MEAMVEEEAEVGEEGGGGTIDGTVHQVLDAGLVVVVRGGGGGGGGRS